MSDFLLGYTMVATCPPAWTNTETARACSSTNYSADPLTALPVLNMTTNLTFANTYCAMCHGKSRNLHLWTLKIYSKWNDKRQPSLWKITSPGIMWEATPVGKAIPDRCVSTEPDTKTKQFCRSYANSLVIQVNGQYSGTFKNPHCAIMAWYNLSATVTVECSSGISTRLPPFLRSTLFAFSNHVKQTRRFATTNVRVNFNCSDNEVYDPFKERCLKIETIFAPLRGNDTNSTEDAQTWCQGPRFLPTSFAL